MELRRYILHPGRRDELIELFEREFVESQEELGARIVGTFRDVRDPDRFVWIRAFPDMAVRLAALKGFYGGPVWKEHGPAANATMIDSDDVHLLEPEFGEFVPAPGHERVVVAVAAADGPALPKLPEPFVQLRTSAQVNDFPALPVHTRQVRVRIASVPDSAAVASLTAHWPSGVDVLELEPTPRSQYP
ncbi:NIPSNAP family protein [Pseudonocardia sp. CA-107938]|uniref:NIPSNAP family protein n=1 Tax=Pseudonocardia sp. CA-107938 TaxID=3240021 RepID=UPI003D8FA5A7